MFHDFKPSPPKLVTNRTEPRHGSAPEGEWRRIERPIYSKFWRGIHNLIAHPLLTIHRPTGQRLHDYTARKMYTPQPGVNPDVTDND